jgi:hypothetical protein
MQPVGINQGMALGGDNLDVLHADAAQLTGDELSRFLHVRLVFFEGTDAGNAEKSLQLSQKTLLIITSITDCRGGHRSIPFPKEARPQRLKSTAENIPV